MTQLIIPNLSVVGYPDYCLAYVQSVFNVPASDPHDPDAWHGWLDAKFKHTDQPPSDVSVPIWFSWSGTVGGVFSNYGHVAVSTPQGVYTNPLSGSGHKVFASVPALAIAYGVNYVGWSEDIETLRVVEGETMTKEQAQELSLYLRLLDFETVDQANSHSVDDVNHILADPGYAGALAKQIYQGQNWQSQSYKASHYDADVAAGGTQLKTGKYYVA